MMVSRGLVASASLAMACGRQDMGSAKASTWHDVPWTSCSATKPRVNVHLLPSSSSSVADHAASSMHSTCSSVAIASRLGASACNTAMAAESRCTRSWG